jgi:predicted dehydrogenase
VKIFKAGLIGCGFFAQHHLEAWRRMPNVQLVAACDYHIERARAAAARAYTSAEEMLRTEELDFVDIVTRSAGHLDLIALAVEKKLSIICQKPLAPDWETACRIVEIADKNRILLMVHDNWRWQPWYRAAGAMIARGDIGIPIGYSFRFRRKDGVGPEPYPNQTYFRKLRRQMIDETLVHHIDTARFIFGEITSVYGEALRRNPGILGEDYAILTLRHLKDVIGTIDGNRFLDLDDGPGTDEASFEGESGSIRITARCDIWSGSKKIWTNDVVSGYRGDSVYATQAHFVDCLKTGRPCESSVGEYLEKTFAVVEAAYQSLGSGRRVQTTEILSTARG